uniref:Transposase n=1 Tax=Caenorhabditis tropicalis TaxID=1561998 RepID=A0A1I7USJ7_9PELO
MFKAKRRLLKGKTVWIFGMIERNSNKVLMFQVEKRDATTLLPLIEEHVLNESRETKINTQQPGQWTKKAMLVTVQKINQLKLPLQPSADTIKTRQPLRDLFHHMLQLHLQDMPTTNAPVYYPVTHVTLEQPIEQEIMNWQLVSITI